MKSVKNIFVIGAGATGDYVGGSLAKLGHNVAFLCRPKTADVIRSEGFFLQTDSGSAKVNVDVYESAHRALSEKQFDLIIIAVKRYDTERALESLSEFTGVMPAIINLQNGVGAEKDLAEILNMKRIIPATVTTAVGRPALNKVVVERYRGIGIAGPLPEAAYWCDEFYKAGLGCRYYENGDSMKWSKLITNLIANPVSAILDMTPPEIYADKDLFRLEIFQLREALAVMKEMGIKVVDLPGAPVRLLAFCANSLPLKIAQPLMGSALGKGRGGKMPSFHGDLHSGSGKSEVHYLHAAVVREGIRLGVPTPVNRMLVDVLERLISGDLDVENFRHRPEKLLKQLN